MAKNKTIAFFNGVYLPHLGGVERYTFELASRLKKDYNVIIVTANTENLPAEADEGGIKVFRLPVKNLPKNKRLPFLKKNEVYKKLVEKIENLDIDQIVCNTRFYETTLLGCKIAQKKHITPWVINHSGGYVLKPYEDYITKKVLKYRPKFYAVSKTSSKFLKNEYGVETANIFYNAISRAKDFKKPENKTVKILYAGRLIKGKGLEILLKAFELVKNKCDVELVIAGDGPLKKLIKDDEKIKDKKKRLSMEELLEMYNERKKLYFDDLSYNRKKNNYKYEKLRIKKHEENKKEEQKKRKLKKNISRN
jgi:glycosyltransferase involved in cell wall biosynthesis